MISLWNLAWIIPLSAILGMFLAIISIANRDDKKMNMPKTETINGVLLKLRMRLKLL